MWGVYRPESIENSGHDEEIYIKPQKWFRPKNWDAEDRRDAGRCRRQTKIGAELFTCKEPNQDRDKAPSHHGDEEQPRLREKGYEHFGFPFGGKSGAFGMKSHFTPEGNDPSGSALRRNLAESFQISHCFLPA